MSDVIQPICRHTKWSVWGGSKAACKKKAKQGSLYCGIHDPVAKKAREQKRYEEFKARDKIERDMRAKANAAAAEQARRAACFDELVAALSSCRAEIWRLLDVKGVEPKVARDWIEIKAADAALANAKGKKE